MREEDVSSFVLIQDRSFQEAGPGIRASYPKERAMDAGELAAFLEEKHYAVLATSRPDGRPHAAPIAFMVWEGAFWIASVKGARVRNLHSRPYAAIVVMEGEGKEHRAVIAEGPVNLYDPNSPAVPEELWVAWRQRFGGAPGWAAVLVELRPQRLFSYDASKGSNDR